MYTFVKVWTQDFMEVHQVFTTKAFQNFDETERKCKFIIFDMKLF